MNDIVVKTNPMEEFQNKLKEKVRSDIASLLPEEAITELVKKAIEEEFFKRQSINEGSGSWPKWVEKPSLFVQEVIKASEPIMKEEIRKAVEQQRPLLEEGIKQYLAENNLTIIIATAIAQAMQTNTYQVVQDIMNNVKRY
jgi:hypothetical protein